MKIRTFPDLLVDETDAVLTTEQFEELPEYSLTIPTGTYIGKRWKRRWPPVSGSEWWLGEFVEHPEKPDEFVNIHWRRIHVVG